MRAQQVHVRGAVPSQIETGSPVFLLRPDGLEVASAVVKDGRFEILAAFRFEIEVANHSLLSVSPDHLQLVAYGATCTASAIIPIREEGFQPSYSIEEYRVELSPGGPTFDAMQRSGILGRARLYEFNRQQVERALPPLAISDSSADALDWFGREFPPPLVPVPSGPAWWIGGPGVDFDPLLVMRSDTRLGGYEQPWQPPYWVLIPGGSVRVETSAGTINLQMRGAAWSIEANGLAVRTKYRP
jgi:hypothetical protein